MTHSQTFRSATVPASSPLRVGGAAHGGRIFSMPTMKHDVVPTRRKSMRCNDSQICGRKDGWVGSPRVSPCVGVQPTHSGRLVSVPDSVPRTPPLTRPCLRTYDAAEDRMTKRRAHNSTLPASEKPAGEAP